LINGTKYGRKSGKNKVRGNDKAVMVFVFVNGAFFGSKVGFQRHLAGSAWGMFGGSGSQHVSQYGQQVLSQS
jgi:hypothetical protein